MYPLLAFSAGYAFQKIYEYTKDLIYIRFLPALTILIVLLWSASFINIYSQPHTRITASNWINEHIPTGSTIAVEHWDDRLPINGSERYNMIELTLYDRPDDQYKWALMNQKLQAADYIVIASNRLYVPLQKLDDCSKYISCYPITSQYYKALFDGKLPFKKVAEFSVYPNIIPSFSFTRINDQTADESFTVYDHPRILIYKHIRPQYSYVY
jgi:hypothetical protein